MYLQVMSSKVTDCLKELKAATADNDSVGDKVAENHRVTCGLMLLPCHLQEDQNLFIKEYPVCISL